jgi:hypothetical protein
MSNCVDFLLQLRQQALQMPSDEDVGKKISFSGASSPVGKMRSHDSVAQQ